MVIICYMLLLRALTSHLAKLVLIFPRTREEISPTNLIITAFDRKSGLLFYIRSNLLLLFYIIHSAFREKGQKTQINYFSFQVYMKITGLVQTILEL